LRVDNETYWGVVVVVVVGVALGVVTTDVTPVVEVLVPEE